MTAAKIIFTMGDPAGVGPELCARALAVHGHAGCAVLISGDVALMQEAFQKFTQLKPKVWQDAKAPTQPGIYLGQSCTVDLKGLVRGQPSAIGGRASLDAINDAAQACLRGDYQAMVTAPASKEAITLCGETFDGHTGWISKLCGTYEEMMLMHAADLNVGYVTTHVSLRSLPECISQARVLACLRMMAQFLCKIDHPNRTVAVCGLNPHAGENGLFGNEEIEEIIPAIQKAQAEGLEITGPFPADTLFVPMIRNKYGAILAMYHDQGGIPFKMHAFDTGVNTTLGLPILRTSVDHGTAWDIAWQGVASPQSMISAFQLALKLSAH